MTHRIFLTLVVAVALSLAGAAHAALITYSGSVNIDAVGNPYNVNVSQFNPGLGTLTAVTVRIYQTAQAGFSIDNDDVLARTAYAQMVRMWSLTGGAITDSAIENFVTPNQALGADNGDGTGTVDFTGPDGYDWGTVVANELHNTHNVGAGSFGTYTGVGNVTYAVNMQILTNAIGWTGTASNSYQSQVLGGGPNHNIEIYVDYEYDSDYVPEPCTMVLLPLGLAGFGIWRRRRAAAAA